MLVPFRIVDVFTDRPFAGNPLCVVPDSTDMTVEQMRAIAREIGFSETTFVIAAEGDRYQMRIFTPEKEMPFAGHPTLGTAFLLVSEGRVTSPVTQEVAAGEFAVEVDLEARFSRVRQHPPQFGPELEDRARLAEAVGLSPKDLHRDLPSQPVSTGLTHLIVPLRDAGAVGRARMNPDVVSALLQESGADGLYVFALTKEGAKARLFAPAVVWSEDPATGSAAGPLGAYLAVRGAGRMPGTMTIRQGEEAGRPSVLHVQVDRDGDTWTVIVGGGVAIVGRGEFDI